MIDEDIMCRVATPPDKPNSSNPNRRKSRK